METEKLIGEIDVEENALYRAGRTNHQTDLVLWYAAIIASFVATILAALGDVAPWLTAAIAALPGLCASLQRVIDFRGRSAWYFQKASQMKALLLNVKYQGMTVQDGAKRWGEIETSYEEIWSRLVKTGAPAPTGESSTGEPGKG
jgi:hypothetical protein